MNMRRALGNLLSQPDPFHFVLGQLLLHPVVELGRAGTLVRRHLLRVLSCAAVREIGGYAGRGDA